MTKTTRTPAELRNMFGENLRRLSRRYPSISELSRQLGINRTQFNRYLSGESFPRPDVLDRICNFFNVDARILLDPVDAIPVSDQILSGPVLSEFFGPDVTSLNEDDFPSGFYRFTRRSFVNESKFVLGLVYVFRESNTTYIRGYEALEAMRQQDLPDDPRTREFRGYVTREDDGVTLLISRRNAMTFSFNYLSRVASFENNFWVGYVSRSVREPVSGHRITRLVYEHLGRDKSSIWKTARQAGFLDVDQLLPFHRRLLRPDDPFL
ncbi:helix-turn-helix transcriptional regulator [Ruegeria pomeroyi]|nr:helix-turn-helix transcriptional regulator [Ruegeria pomeroyi]MCE8519486.1 helix-turn-helix transcriptional regulator [Ruegeria pomeroyi]MCE8528285.1 helix-turn-helix transcriptional regulator [Ruegeria pomeroyi]MCE8531886.1 helix-turn-helix transcriptional regulator [Ruegeria pomeroyi]MCE8545800.1 helix-turn-helix transcriptional regulator [Ruegeria pomeroyi]